MHVLGLEGQFTIIKYYTGVLSMPLTIEQMGQLKNAHYNNLADNNSGKKGICFGSFEQFQKNVATTLGATTEVTMSDYLGTYLFASPWAKKELDAVVSNKALHLSDRVLDMLYDSKTSSDQAAQDLDQLTGYSAEIKPVLVGIAEAASGDQFNKQNVVLEAVSGNERVNNWIRKAKNKITDDTILASEQLRQALYVRANDGVITLSDPIRQAIQTVCPEALNFLGNNIIDDLSRSAVSIVNGKKYLDYAGQLSQSNQGVDDMASVYPMIMNKVISINMGDKLLWYKNGAVWQPSVLFDALLDDYYKLPQLPEAEQAKVYGSCWGRYHEIQNNLEVCQRLLEQETVTPAEEVQLQNAVRSLGYRTDGLDESRRTSDKDKQDMREYIKRIESEFSKLEIRSKLIQYNQSYRATPKQQYQPQNANPVIAIDTTDAAGVKSQELELEKVTNRKKSSAITGAVAGVITAAAVVGVALLAVGTVVAAPIVLPMVIGVGILAAITSFGSFVANRIFSKKAKTAQAKLQSIEHTKSAELVVNKAYEVAQNKTNDIKQQQAALADHQVAPQETKYVNLVITPTGDDANNLEALKGPQE